MADAFGVPLMVAELGEPLITALFGVPLMVAVFGVRLMSAELGVVFFVAVPGVPLITVLLRRSVRPGLLVLDRALFCDERACLFEESFEDCD